ncbi:MAG: hypothetical protein EZS28_025056, partial [Streblomastix strix]
MSIRATLSQRIGAGLSLFVIACLIANPGHPTLAARDYSIFTRKVYDICKCWCRQIQCVEGHGRMPMYITQERQEALTGEFLTKIRGHVDLSEEYMLERIMQSRQDELTTSTLRARRLKLAGKCGVDPNRLRAQCWSNIKDWFRQIYSEDLIEDIRDRGVYNMNETSLQIDGKQRIAKVKRMKSSPEKAVERLGTHITFCPTLSVGHRSPPPFVILEKLVKVLANLYDIVDSQQAVIHTSASGFFNNEIFLDWTRYFVQWIQKQREEKYLTDTEPILLLLDGHYSRNALGVKSLLESQNIRALTFPGQLTQILQPMDVAVFGAFRYNYNKLVIKKLQDARNNLTNANKTSAIQVLKRLFSIEAAIDAFQQSTPSSNNSIGSVSV